VLEESLSKQGMINVIVGAKTQEPRWLTPHNARVALNNGVMTWDFASDDDPHVVLAAAGDYMTKEMLAAIDTVKNEKPELRLRFVNIMVIGCNCLGSSNAPISLPDFNDLFTEDKPVILNFHGYPETLKSIVYNYTEYPRRFVVHGYSEVGSTTTPFDMHVRNNTDRWHLAIEIFEAASEQGLLSRDETEQLIIKYRNKIDENIAYIKQHGLDLPEVDEWQWNR
jgi:xylulose-5-phosphate/fructose-6-phosphate phosphoketolase